jgi:hypothetical protein
LIKALMNTAAATRLSGVHVGFPGARDRDLLERAGWLSRLNVQFHWHNPGYRDFSDFLGQLISERRYAIRRERRLASGSGVRIFVLSGADIREEHMVAFARLYPSTFAKHGDTPLLPPEYFPMLGHAMADQLLLVMARDGDRWVGGTLKFIGKRTLFSRSWAGEEGYPFLYFDVTHYYPMEFAIANGLTTLEGGAGGVFKLARGYRPARVWSSHHFTLPDMKQAVATHLQAETATVEAQIAQWEERSGYREA